MTTIARPLIDNPGNVRLIFYVNGVAIIVSFDYARRPTIGLSLLLIMSQASVVRMRNNFLS